MYNEKNVSIYVDQSHYLYYLYKWRYRANASCLTWSMKDFIKTYLYINMKFVKLSRIKCFLFEKSQRSRWVLLCLVLYSSIKFIQWFNFAIDCYSWNSESYSFHLILYWITIYYNLVQLFNSFINNCFYFIKLFRLNILFEIYWLEIIRF